jgi:hypothetical protein
MKNVIHAIILASLVPLLFGCPRNDNKKASREIYQNRMDFNFKDTWKINFGSLSFILPKKFKNDYYTSICINGGKCKSYSIEDLNLYLSISEIKKNEASNIMYITNEKNILHAIQADAAMKRKKSLYNDKGKISEISIFKTNPSIIYQTVIESFEKEYSWETDNSSIYYISTIQKKNRFYVIQFTGKGENMRYLLDDFKRILSGIK